MLADIPLYIYLGSTVMNWAVAFAFNAKCERNFKKKGYVYTRKPTFVEKTLSPILTMAVLSVPGLGVAYTGCILFGGNKIYKDIEEDYLDRDVIYNPTQEEDLEEDIPYVLEQTSDMQVEAQYQQTPRQSQLESLRKERAIWDYEEPQDTKGAFTKN